MATKLLNFARGAGSILDLMPTRERHTFGASLLARSDSEVLAGDMELVGEDFRAVMDLLTNGEIDGIREKAREAANRPESPIATH